MHLLLPINERHESDRSTDWSRHDHSLLEFTKVLLEALGSSEGLTKGAKHHSQTAKGYSGLNRSAGEFPCFHFVFNLMALSVPHALRSFAFRFAQPRVVPMDDLFRRLHDSGLFHTA